VISRGEPAPGEVLDGEDKGKALQYESWEERCDACRIYLRDPEEPRVPVSGEQEPCCTEAKLALIVKETKGLWPCPRRFLEPEYAELVMLANMAIGESPLLTPMIDSLTSDMEPSEVRSLIMAIEGVRGHRLVSEALERARERASKKATEKRG